MLKIIGYIFHYGTSLASMTTLVPKLYMYIQINYMAINLNNLKSTISVLWFVLAKFNLKILNTT